MTEVLTLPRVFLYASPYGTRVWFDRPTQAFLLVDPAGRRSTVGLRQLRCSFPDAVAAYERLAWHAGLPALARPPGPAPLTVPLW